MEIYPPSWFKPKHLYKFSHSYVNHSIILVVCCLALVACGGSGGSGGDSGEASNNTTSPSTENPEPLTLNLGAPSFRPNVLPPSGDLTRITFVSVISGTAYPNTLSLDEIDQDGRVIGENVGELRDDGEGADVYLGDRVYTGTLLAGSISADQKYYRVRANNAGESVESGVGSYWVSGCPARARPSNPQQVVADRPPSEGLIFANEVMMTVAESVLPDLTVINDLANEVGGRVVGCIPTLRQYLLELTNDSEPSVERVYDAIDQLLADNSNRVVAAAPNAQVMDLPASEPFDCVGQECQWYLDRIRAPEAWEIAGAGDEQQSVAVIDFGVDCNHPELGCNGLVHNQDLIDHGTGVASLIGADNLDNTGFTGIAWNTDIYPYSFLSEGGSQYKMSELINRSLGEANVKVINISAVTSIDPNNQIRDSICSAIDSGRLVVVAAGNAQANQRCELNEIYPARYNSEGTCANGADLQTGLLVVGATDIDNNLAEWGDANNRCSNTRHIDIFAPGEDIYTASAAANYAAKSGTSYAAPLAAGSAAVLWAAQPSFTPAEVHNQLTGSASLLDSQATNERLQTVDARVDGQPMLDLFRALGGVDSPLIPDTTPEPFSFSPSTGISRSELITSNAITVSGIDNFAPIDVVGGFYSIDQRPFTSAAGTIEVGQQLRVRVLSADTFDTAQEAQVSVGGVLSPFRVTTAPADTTPDNFDFLDRSNVSLNDVITSNTLVIPGIDAETAISITGGEYSINGLAYTAEPGSINETDSIQLRVTSAATPETPVNVSVVIGGVSDDFTVVTENRDIEPTPFVFAEEDNVALNAERTTNTVVISDINTDSVISVSGGEYAIDGGAFISAASTIQAGQSVQVRQTSASTPETTTFATLTVGSYSELYGITTLPLESTPAPFTFVSQTGIAPNTVVVSNPITISGINTEIPISISGGQYRINGGTFTAGSGTVREGDVVEVQVTAAATLDTTLNASLIVGIAPDTVTDVFSVSTSGNTPPVANDDLATTAEDTPINNIDVLSNDTDVDGDSLSVSLASASNGSVTINADNTLNYTPNTNYNGSDSISYTLSDGNGGIDTATLALTISPINDAPLANDDTAISLDEDTSVNNINVLGNDTDADGEILIVSAASATSGAVFINPNNTLNYTPTTNYNGPDIITYTANDSVGVSDTATIAVTVNPVNDDPMATNDTAITLLENTTVSNIDVLSNDIDVDGDSLSVIEASATNGNVIINADNTLNYTPNANFNGSDTIGYTVSDGSDTDGAAIAVTVTPEPIPAPVVSVSAGQTTLRFSWAAVPQADYFYLLENPDGSSGFTRVGSLLAAGSTSTELDIPVHLIDWPNAQYLVEACDTSDVCTQSPAIGVLSEMIGAITYVKASNTDTDDYFGHSVALSADGNTLAIGAISESSNAKGINGDETNNLAPGSGAVYIYTRSISGAWSQQAYIKASNAEAGDIFGSTVALSEDGNTLAVGATDEDSAATGINGDQANNSLVRSGAVYVFSRSVTTWSQQAYIKASNTAQGFIFGEAIAISEDGNTLAVGSNAESSGATGVNGNQVDTSAGSSGAVYVYSRVANTWSQQAYIKSSNSEANDRFGGALALSTDGSTLAVGAVGEESAATGVNGDQTDNTADTAGAVYVFSRTGVAWSQQAYIKASNSEANDFFGYTLSLSGDGNFLSVSAINEDSLAIGINGDQTDNSGNDAGAIYIFARTGTIWSQEAYIKASNTKLTGRLTGDKFGYSQALSSDGNTLAVSARDDSAAIGINGDQTDVSAFNSGAVYIFRRAGNSWSQEAYVKASNTDVTDDFGINKQGQDSVIGISSDGSTLAVGAPVEASNAVGINGDQTDNSASSVSGVFGAGAVYLY